MRVLRSNNNLAAPRWAADYFDREHLVPFPIKLDPSQFSDGAGVNVALTGDASPGTNEQQTITINATGGTFKVTFAGQQTGAIAWNASADAVRDALEALSSGGVGNFQVSLNTLVYTVTFINALGNSNQPAMTTDATSLTGGAGTAVVATLTPGAVGTVTLSVTALGLPGTVLPAVTGTAPLIPANSILQFGAGQYVTTTADANAGDVSIAVQPVTTKILSGSVAVFSRFNTKTLLSGTLIGRSLAERLANTPFGPAALDGSDVEVYAIAYEVTDMINLVADATAYRPGSVIRENYLPQWTALNTGPYASLLAQLRTKYVCITGKD